MTRLVALLSFALLLLGLLLAVSRVRADDGLELAQGGLHESGAHVTSDELAAMWAVATRTPRRHPMRAQMPRLFAGTTPRAPGILRLTRRTMDPGLLAVADAVVRGEIAHSCPSRPIAWGMRSGVDLRRALRFGWRRLDCGRGCRNYFWGRR